MNDTLEYLQQKGLEIEMPLYMFLIKNSSEYDNWKIDGHGKNLSHLDLYEMAYHLIISSVAISLFF